MPNRFNDAAGFRTLQKTMILSAQRAALRTAKLARRQERIVAYIGTRFTDPSVSAGEAARALGMSLRGLHLALADTGESFNKAVRRHRLAACRVRLQAPQRSDSVTEIAFSCGFNSLSSFYRALESCETNAGRLTVNAGGYVPPGAAAHP